MIMEKKVYTPIKGDKGILKEKQKAKEVQENKQDRQTPSKPHSCLKGPNFIFEGANIITENNISC